MFFTISFFVFDVDGWGGFLLAISLFRLLGLGRLLDAVTVCCRDKGGILLLLAYPCVF